MAKKAGNVETAHARRVVEARKIILASPLGPVLHTRVRSSDTLKKVQSLLAEVYDLAPRGLIMQLSGINQKILIRYKNGERFPDTVRLLAMLKAAHLIFSASDVDQVDALLKLSPARMLEGKSVVVREVDLQVVDLPFQTSETTIVATPKTQAAPSMHSELPPNLVGAHLNAIRNTVDAFDEMVRFGQVQLCSADRHQLACIVLALIRIGELDHETFSRAFSGDPKAKDSRVIHQVLKAFGKRS